MNRIDYHIPFYKNHYFHIYNHAIGKELLFYKPENYKYFFKQYKNYLQNLVSTYAFCLLQNHFHMLIRSESENPGLISEQFRKFFISYSMSINKQENRQGGLFERGFKRRIIEDETHLLNVTAYIHTNPVHHNITSGYKNYPYSSYRLFLSSQSSTIRKNEVLEWFGGLDSFIEFHETLRKNITEKYFVIE